MCFRVTDQVSGVVNSIIGGEKEEAPKEEKSKKLKPIGTAEEERPHTRK